MISEKEEQKLRDKIRRLEEEIERLKKIEKKFEEFKANHAKTVSELRKALNIKQDKKTNSKPLGAPKGHTGYSRKIPERIDYIKALNPSRCPHCNTKLGRTQEIRHRHVTDIKLISKVETTKYDIHRKYCPKCGKLVEPEVPNVLSHARFGLNLMLLVMYLRLGLRLPGKKVCEYLQTIYSLNISEGEIVHILKQLVVVFGDHYTTLEKMVKLARIKHTDSTSWRIDGKNYFAWVFIAAGVVLYKIRKRNNSKVPLSVFGTKQKGNILVIDRYSALRALAEKAGFMLQLCWSHILEDSKELAKSFGKEGRYVHKRLKEIYGLAKGLNHKGDQEQVEQLKAEIFQLTARHYTHTAIRRFVNNLFYRDIENLFRFVTDKDIDSTNNLSERELRELVIIRNISKGSRSRRGANTTAMLLSIIQTIRLKKENILQGLQKIINNPSGY
jgi:transposase